MPTVLHAHKSGRFVELNLPDRAKRHVEAFALMSRGLNQRKRRAVYQRSERSHGSLKIETGVHRWPQFERDGTNAT
jgi:hypothetical protein